MLCFIKGGFGMLFVLILAAIVVPMYCDYTDRVITSKMLISVKPLQEAIEIEIKNNNKKSIVGIDINKFSLSPQIKETIITIDGTIIIQGGEVGQIIVLKPSLENSEISWYCLGGTYKTMPVKCRNDKIN